MCEEGTDLQRGGKVSGVCFKEGHKVPDPNWVLYTDGTSLIKTRTTAVRLAKWKGPPRLKRDGGNCQVANYWYWKS